jgi:hypothetical protein
MKKPGEAIPPAANKTSAPAPTVTPKQAIPLTSTDGGKTYRPDLPDTVRDPSVPYYREIPNSLAYLNNITFSSREEANKAYENALKNDAAAKQQNRTGIPQ